MGYVVYIKWGKKRPDLALVVNISNNNKHCFSLWSSGNSIKRIKNDEKKLKTLLENLHDVLMVDYKSFVDYFGKLKSPVVYDCFYENHDDILIKLKKDYKNGLLFTDWQKIRAESVEAYCDIEKRGIQYEYKVVSPKYKNDVFSGRSKTTGYNIQGKNSGDDIRHCDPKFNIFLTFDWISADARMASVISGDEKLIECFKYSDPYSYIADALDNKVSRDSCKSEWNRAVNSLDCDNGIFKLFPTFSKWLKNEVHLLSKNGYTESILGRRFYSDGTYKQNKRAINSIFQGSVAHAMQNSVVRINEITNGILTEQHDSITICTSEALMSKHANKFSEIIFKPLLPYNEIEMPLRIGVGKSWGEYKYFKECR